jgi:hypothetical protein
MKSPRKNVEWRDKVEFIYLFIYIFIYLFIYIYAGGQRLVSFGVLQGKEHTHVVVAFDALESRAAALIR